MRVLIGGPVRLYRESLAHAFGHAGGYEVVGTASTSSEVLELARALGPDVVLADATMPDLAALARELADRSDKVVILGVSEAEEGVIPLIEAGISGYVTGEASLGDVFTAVDRAARGESVVSPRIVAGMMQRLAKLKREHISVLGPSSLTSREQEIASLLDEGLSNREIALRLQIELPTVKNHVHNILEKLQVHRRGEAAARLRGFAIRPLRQRCDTTRSGAATR
jgi:DNA-binding NarL/FixJ family response regulator